MICFKEKKLKEAEIIFVDMEKQGLVPNRFCYCTLMHAYFQPKMV